MKGLNLSVHGTLSEWNKHKGQRLYLSSILMINKNVPLFEEEYGMFDYDWLLKVTENRNVILMEPTVVRYIDGHNLSLQGYYRQIDYELIKKKLGNNQKAINRLNGTQGRYLYFVQNWKGARYFFAQSNKSWKNVLYYITSYVPGIREIIIKQFRVFG